MIQVIDGALKGTPRVRQVLLPLVGQPLDARVPLSLLEAVRGVDTPDVDPDTEFVHELRNKRLGLSETVDAQIGRYSDMVRKSRSASYQEVLALSRLIGRRPDAEIIFRDAGQRLAHAAIASFSTAARKAAVALPALVGRPLALRRLRRAAGKFLSGKLHRQGGALVLEVIAPVSADAAPGSVGCGLYEAALRVLLETLADTDPVIEHVACRARGDASCQWRTSWRKR